MKGDNKVTNRIHNPNHPNERSNTMSTPTVSRTIEIPEVTYRNLETVYGANITKFRSRKAVILAAIEIGVAVLSGKEKLVTKAS